MKTRIVVVILAVVYLVVYASAQGAASKPAMGQVSQKAAVVPKLLKDGAYAGEIRAFAGEACPAGWLTADGNTYNTTQYTVLQPVLGDRWGVTKPNTFQVPDLRGVFLRGWNAMGTQGNRADKYADPDASSRELPPGSPENPPTNPDTNVIGSYQLDAIQSHQHRDAGHAHDMMFTYQNAFACGSACGALTVPNSGGNLTKPSAANIGDPSSSPTGGSARVTTQTRPVNAYVLFCIRDGNTIP